MLLPLPVQNNIAGIASHRAWHRVTLKKRIKDKIMRKIVLTLIVALGMAGGYAQNETGKFSIKPMSAQEAILQMNLLGHSFYLFCDSQTEETCAVYKRRDGAYGLIVPQK